MKTDDLFQSFELKDFSFRLDGLLVPVQADPNAPVVLVEAQMQPDESLYYRIQAELGVYLRQYRPANPWLGVVIYPDVETERAIPHLEKLLAFGNLYRVYLDQLPAGGSFGIELLRLIIQPPERVEVQGKELVERLRQVEAEVSQRCLDWVTEVMSRKFPDKGEREIRKMLGLAELEQTKAYQEGRQEGQQQEASALIQRLIQQHYQLPFLSGLK